MNTRLSWTRKRRAPRLVQWNSQPADNLNPPRPALLCKCQHVGASCRESISWRGRVRKGACQKGGVSGRGRGMEVMAERGRGMEGRGRKEVWHGRA